MIFLLHFQSSGFTGMSLHAVLTASFVCMVGRSLCESMCMCAHESVCACACAPGYTKPEVKVECLQSFRTLFFEPASSTKPVAPLPNIQQD